MFPWLFIFPNGHFIFVFTFVISIVICIFAHYFSACSSTTQTRLSSRTRSLQTTVEGWTWTAFTEFRSLTHDSLACLITLGTQANVGSQGHPLTAWQLISRTHARGLNMNSVFSTQILYSSCASWFRLPLKSGLQGRSTGGRNRYTPSYGIVMDEGAPWYLFSYTFTNLRWS
jgi:hypothetical protein